MMRLVVIRLLVAFLLLGTFERCETAPTTTTPVFQPNQATDSTAFINAQSFTLPQTFRFAGEAFPMQDWDVRERFDREVHSNVYWHSQTLLVIKRASRWFPVIEPILKKHNVPDDFKYLAVAESGLSNSRSPAGARGFWQFLSSTGKSHGLEINKEVDERYHLEKATEAACAYLIKAHDELGSWIAAAAAYNMGKAGLKRQFKKQLTDNYFDLLLNTETSRYVFRLAAFKLLLNNPEAYGFNIPMNTLYPRLQYRTLVVDSAINNLSLWAKQQGANYKQVKKFNPWLRANSLPDHPTKKYEIRIPTTGFSTFTTLEIEEEASTESDSLER